MLREPMSRSRPSPPLLSSASLEGMERFVPPERSPQGNCIPEWKLNKPLPHLPRRTSSMYNFNDMQHSGGAKGQRDGRGLSSKVPRLNLGEILNTCSMEDLSARRIRKNGQGGTGADLGFQPIPPLPPSLPLRKDWYENNDRDTAPTKRLRRSPVPGPQPQGAQSSGSPDLRKGFEAGNCNHKKRRTIRIDKPQTPKTNNLVDLTLVPLPLEIDGSPQSRSELQPLLPPVRFEDRQVSLCFNSHPCHGDAVLAPSSSEAPSPEFARPQTASSTATAKPMPSAVQPDRVEIANNCPWIPKLSLDSDSPNRTQLYSFSADTSVCETPSKSDSNSNSDTNGVSNGTQDRVGTSDSPQPPQNLSHPQRAPSPFTSPQLPAPTPLRQRKKQLAIPPTGYQQLGPKAWSKTGTKPKNKTIQMLPRLVSKLIPKSLRSWSGKSQLQEIQQQPAPPLQKVVSTQGHMKSRQMDAKGAPPDELGRVGASNKSAWRSTLTLGRRNSREKINRSEKKWREELKSHIVMVGPTAIRVVDDEVRWV